MSSEQSHPAEQETSGEVTNADVNKQNSALEEDLFADMWLLDNNETTTTANVEIDKGETIEAKVEPLEVTDTVELEEKREEDTEITDLESQVVEEEENSVADYQSIEQADNTQEQQLEETVLPEEDTTPHLNLEDEEAFSPTLGETTSSPPILELESDLGKEDTAVKTEQAKDEPTTVTTLQEEIANLTQEKSNLIAEIEQLEQQKKQIIAQQTAELQNSLQNMIQIANANLEERQQALQVSIEQLERRRERIKQEMRTTFAGASQELAVRVQGFKDYLVGSLQDLATAAEQLKLPTYQAKPTPPPANLRQSNRQRSPQEQNLQPEFANNQKFQDQSQRIRDLLDRYRTRPDYYGRPWQLRRTFEPIHAEKVRQWFFSQGGRGSIKTMGSRLQNILVASTIISVLHMLYGSRCRSLILADTPERLGEWRRGLQDCLGISRTDFGPNRGITLFESAEALIQKAERLQAEKLLPLIIIDETEENINLGLLQFPLWLAFAPDPKQAANYNYMY